VGSLSRIRRLSWVECGLLANALMLVALTRLGLTCLPFWLLNEVLVSSERTRPSRNSSAKSLPVSQVVWAVIAASRWIPKATCLTQALAAQCLLKRNGHPAMLRLGVRKEGERLAAHAWLESQGRIVIGGLGAEGCAPLMEAGESGQ
jgi:hypothetical protein